MKRPPYAKVKHDIYKKRMKAWEDYLNGKFITKTMAAISCNCNYDQFRNWLKLNNVDVNQKPVRKSDSVDLSKGISKPWLKTNKDGEIIESYICGKYLGNGYYEAIKI